MWCTSDVKRVDNIKTLEECKKSCEQDGKCSGINFSGNACDIIYSEKDCKKGSIIYSRADCLRNCCRQKQVGDACTDGKSSTLNDKCTSNGCVGQTRSALNSDQNQVRKICRGTSAVCHKWQINNNNRCEQTHVADGTSCYPSHFH